MVLVKRLIGVTKTADQTLLLMSRKSKTRVMITITIITIDEEEEDGALKRKERLIVVINRLIKHCR